MKFGKKAMKVIDYHIGKEFPGNDPSEVPTMNLWEFYNVITWYITHYTASLNHQVVMEGRLRAAMIDF
ncbi:MAG: hypothetical protein HGJ94_16850 [Desulfosarcina sp.]|nr:hypothetical protein [Desulfosarcina sp.]MBC2744270.1 hypothetical protein [Desulfosarcina sp.]MBC2767179.1 hypothetical protein [Desulfosarcina sp.]